MSDEITTLAEAVEYLRYIGEHDPMVIQALGVLLEEILANGKE